jgi:hypothetical protein
VSLFGRGSKLMQASGEFGQRDTGSQDLGPVLLEKRLDADPAGLLAAVGEQGGGVEQEAQRR